MEEGEINDLRTKDWHIRIYFALACSLAAGAVPRVFRWRAVTVHIRASANYSDRDRPRYDCTVRELYFDQDPYLPRQSSGFESIILTNLVDGSGVLILSFTCFFKANLRGLASGILLFW